MKGAILVFSSCEALLLIERTRKNAEMAPFNSNGAGEGSRTEGPTPEKNAPTGANMVRVRVVETLSQVWKTCILTAVLHPQRMGWDIGIEPTTFWTTIRRSNHLS